MNLKNRHATRDAAREHEIDLALAVMCALQEPGQVVSSRAIADVTGMSHGGPWSIEKVALKKLRNRLKFGYGVQLGKELG